jgi:hypothetical protein
MTFAATGCLRLDDFSELVGAELSPSGLDAMRVRAVGQVHVRPGGSVFSVRTRVEGRAVFLAATFEPDRLASVELVLLDGPGSDGLAEQDKLKAEHQRWLASLDIALAPLPFMLDGQPIMPATMDESHPRHAVTEWGEVVSLRDPKNGSASIIIRYKS